MYKLLKDNLVLHLESNSVIPFDPANQDFVEYNKWLSEGGVPLPADETN